MTEVQRKKQFKLVLAGAGAAAVVAMGTLGAMVSESPAGADTLSDLPAATIGETVTLETGKTELETSVAVPQVKVELPDGYGNG